MLFSPELALQSIRAVFPPLGARDSEGLAYLLSRMAQDQYWEYIQQAAYGLATIKWETAHTWRPITEHGGDEYFAKYEPGTVIGKRLGNMLRGDGLKYKGRGYVQMTGRANYERWAERLGIDLIGHPELATEPDTAYLIAAQGMHYGLFTGHKLSKYVPVGAEADYVGARRVINGTDRAQEISVIAVAIEDALMRAKQ